MVTLVWEDELASLSSVLDSRETSLGRSLATSDVSRGKLSAHNPLRASGLVCCCDLRGGEGEELVCCCDVRGGEGEELAGETAGGDWRCVSSCALLVEISHGVLLSLPSSFTL